MPNINLTNCHPLGGPILLHLLRYRPFAVGKLQLHDLCLTVKVKSIREISGIDLDLIIEK